VEDVTNYTKAGGGCGACHDAIARIIEQAKAEPKADAKPKTYQSSENPDD